MNRESSPEYYNALHSYGRGVVQLLGVFGISQADIARHCGVSRPLVSHWRSGRELMHPTHERAMRRALGEAVQDLQQGLGAMDATALRGLRDGLIPALVDIDGSALAMAREYAASVRAMNRDIMDAVSCALQAHAHTTEVADELHHAYDSAHEALAALQRLWPGAKTRNRGLRALLDLKDDERLLDHVGRLLAYVGETYGVAEPTPAARPGTRARRKARRSSVMAAV